ncbi:siderophore ferric iron reductase [Vibrio inusitatus]|uniref:siderophore ferric iron reductase n=1 Tax=Vibrio inusitatus TaxID=413402 RepID=UPI00142EA2AE|nr:siderophore ferric iron reductase [Vibrio inusitatus]
MQGLLDNCRALSPYLDGQSLLEPKFAKGELWISSCGDELESIQFLYDSIRQAYPDAGRVYWATRTWDLLCWQPLAIAFVAVYQSGVAPSFEHFYQKASSCLITGFQIQTQTLQHDNVESLISRVSINLEALFSDYRKRLNEVTRCSTNFSNQLLADNLLGNLINLQRMSPSTASATLLEQLRFWIEGLKLPNSIWNTIVSSANEPIVRVRRSCCLADRVEGGALCSDCPRLQSNKTLQKKA